MKNLLFIFCLILCWACNNDVTSIGQDLINDDSYVELVKYNIDNSATIKIDSFPTSTGKNGGVMSNLIVGTVQDPITGITSAQPYFSFVPSGGSTINHTHKFDSITFNIKYNGEIWGDTNKIQTFRLYQLSSLPVLNKQNDLLYNTTTTPYNPEPLGTYQILPHSRHLMNFRIRLDDQLGRELFDKVKYGDEYIKNALYFVRYFKGVTLVPDEGNSCIFGFESATDSISIQLHFHDAENQLTYLFTPSTAYSEYTYEKLHNDASGTPYERLTKQTENLPFKEADRPNAKHGQLVTQGLSGFSIKMCLPIAPAGDKYKTIIKAEIELRPQPGSYKEIKLPETLYLYQSNRYNDLIGTINKSDGNVITGKLVRDEERPEEERFVINITDYYNALCQNADADSKNYIIVSVPADLMSSSLNRLTVNRIPVLNIYYALYE